MKKEKPKELRDIADTIYFSVQERFTNVRKEMDVEDLEDDDEEESSTVW